MSSIVNKAKKNTMEAFNKMLDREANVKKQKFYTEAEGDDFEEQPVEPIDDSGMDAEPEKEPYELDDEGKDTLDNVDDILEKIDIASIDNNVKVELITSIIDSIQNSTESDDEFSEIMNQIMEVIENYKFEEGEEEGAEEAEEGGEEPKEGKEEGSEGEEGEGEEEPEEDKE